jgi:hypothetical protein
MPVAIMDADKAAIVDPRIFIAAFYFFWPGRGGYAVKQRIKLRPYVVPFSTSDMTIRAFL